MSTNRGNKPDGVRRRRVRPDGLIEEWSAAMGWVITVPADPQPREIDLSEGAAGWERVREYLRRRLR
jgi:hypothetical protein